MAAAATAVGVGQAPGRACPGALPAPAPTPALAVPARALPRRSVGELLDSAHAGLVDAATTDRPAERYAAAHRSALRAAAAVLAVRAQPTPPGRGRRRGSPSVWTLLAQVAPELREWAAFFAAGAQTRAAAETGRPGAVTVRQADDLLRDAETFVGLVEDGLALPPMLPWAGEGTVALHPADHVPGLSSRRSSADPPPSG